MREKTRKRFPAYDGAEPYLVFCFAEADEKRVLPLLERMYARGTRVWYAVGRPKDRAERAERERRMKDAALALLYLSAAAREDTDFKSAALYSQECGTPLLCIDADRSESGLAFGLSAAAQHLDGQSYHSAVSLEAALVRCEGFSQDLIGLETVQPPSPMRKAAILLAAASVFAFALVLLGGRLFGWFAPEPTYHDSVVITDEALRAAVRAAVGGGDITEEAIASVTTLRLEALPENGEELKLLGALTRVELPQTEAEGAQWLLEDGYTVVLYGGSGA